MHFERDPHAPTPPPGQDELPSDDGEPMESERHRTQMILLIDTLADAWADRQDFYVSGNMFVYFSELQTKGEHFRGPDVFVVLDTIKKERKSWVVWEEGGRLPNVVIELLSESTAEIDRGEKMRIYSRIWRTGQYILYDPFTLALEGYQLDARGEYAPITANARGDVEVAQLGLALGVRPGAIHHEPGPWLRWIDAGGAILPSAAERARDALARADGEKARADGEKARADDAERRVAELERALRERERR
jgi:Uma2 family endonuclease